MRSTLLRQIAGTYSTQILIAVIGLTSSAVIARALGPEGRGQFSAALALGAIGVQFGNLGLHNTNSYLVAKQRAMLPKLVTNSLFVSVLLGGAGAAAIALALGLFPSRLPVHGALLFMTALWIPFGVAYLLAVNLLMGLREVRQYNKVELFSKILSASAIVAVALSGLATPAILFAVALLAVAAGLGFAFYILRGFFEERMTPSFPLFAQNFQLGWKAYLAAFFAFLVIRIDLLMVKAMLGSSAAGYYSIAGTVADYALVLPTTIGAILFPRLAAEPNDHSARKLTLRMMAFASAALIGLLAMLLVFVKPFIVMLFGVAFVPAAGAITLLTPGILFLGIEVVAVQYLNTRGFPVQVVWLWMFSAIGNVALNLWAIPTYGINGASAVSSISYFVAFLGVIMIMAAGRDSAPLRNLPGQGVVAEMICSERRD